MARFFIDRPVFAWVIAIFITLAGIISITQLPVSQYPNIAPPQVTVSATYPGATAKTVEDSVISIIEQEMNGEIGIVGISLYTKERFLITAAHPGGTDNKRQTGAAVFRGMIQVGSEIFGIIDILHDIFLPLK